MAYLLTLDPRPLAELKACKAADVGALIKHLRVYGGYHCLLCTGNGTDASGASDGGEGETGEEGGNEKSDGHSHWRAFHFVHLPTMGRHVPAQHGRKPGEHSDSKPLWEFCSLQTYFTAKSIIDYFVLSSVDAALYVCALHTPTQCADNTTQRRFWSGQKVFGGCNPLLSAGFLA